MPEKRVIVDEDRLMREMSHIEEMMNALYVSDPELKKEMQCLHDDKGMLTLKGVVSEKLWASYKRYANAKAMERSPLQRP